MISWWWWEFAFEGIALQCYHTDVKKNMVYSGRTYWASTILLSMPMKCLWLWTFISSEYSLNKFKNSINERDFFFSILCALSFCKKYSNRKHGTYKYEIVLFIFKPWFYSYPLNTSRKSFERRMGLIAILLFIYWDYGQDLPWILEYQYFHIKSAITV